MNEQVANGSERKMKCSERKMNRGNEQTSECRFPMGPICFFRETNGWVVRLAGRLVGRWVGSGSSVGR